MSNHMPKPVFFRKGGNICFDKRETPRKPYIGRNDPEYLKLMAEAQADYDRAMEARKGTAGRIALYTFR